MKLSFHGAAGCVTGSRHVITLDDGRRLLLDCGMFQGMGKETGALNMDLGFNAESIDLMLLSHAHIDHTGLIPLLIKQGYRGKIYSTPATKELTEILLMDSAEIQEHEASFLNKRRGNSELPPIEALYGVDDVEQAIKQFETINYNEWIDLGEGLEALFSPNGHLIGSAAINVRYQYEGETTRILYSGDVGKYRSVLLKAPQDPQPADYIIMESTYGNKHHDIRFNTIEELLKWIKKICVEQKGKLVLPAFSVGRTQEILYALNQLSLEKRLPDIPCFVDSPLSKKATDTIKHYMDEFNERLQKVLEVDDDPFDFPGLHYVESVEDSRKLVEMEQPCVIISASGTADAGRVRHHIQSCINRAECAIVLVGYCGAKSLGGQLISGSRQIEIFGEPCNVLAETGMLQGMSAHGDTDDLAHFLSGLNAEEVKTVFLVHGEPDVQKAFADRLGLKGFHHVELPEMHQEYNLPLVREKSDAA